MRKPTPLLRSEEGKKTSPRAKMNAYRHGEGREDRATLLALLHTLNASPLAVRDECGAWRIQGRRGHIYAYPKGGSYTLYLDSGSKRKVSEDKKRLSWCEVTQNGDDECCLRLTDLPTPDQAKAIRKVLAIRKRRATSPRSDGAKRTEPGPSRAGQAIAP